VRWLERSRCPDRHDRLYAASCGSTARYAAQRWRIHRHLVGKRVYGRTLYEARQNGFPEMPDPIPEIQPTVDPGPATYSTRKVALERGLLGSRDNSCHCFAPIRHLRERFAVSARVVARQAYPRRPQDNLPRLPRRQPLSHSSVATSQRSYIRRSIFREREYSTSVIPR
jgi:hypothetical protein